MPRKQDNERSKRQRTSNVINDQAAEMRKRYNTSKQQNKAKPQED
jgi:hypothetical protein